MTLFKLGTIKVKLNYLLMPLLFLYYYLGYGLEVLIGLSSVLIHELFHSITANKLGITVKEIELFPFGGIAKVSNNLSGDPSKEIIVSLMGPISNFLLVGLFFIIERFYMSHYVFDMIIKTNISIGLFNILPIFPLDGGRILRGHLSRVMGFKSATKILSKTTYVLTFLGVLFGVIVLIMNKNGIYFILLSCFIFIAAKKEKNMAVFLFMGEIIKKREELLNRRIMGSHILVALNVTTGKEILDCFLPQKYHIIIIIDHEGKAVGYIKENELLDGIIENGIDVPLESLLNNTKK